MKTNFLFLCSFLLLITSCNSSKEIKIDDKMMLEAIKTLSSDSFEGRGFSKPGNYEAAKFIDNKFNEIGLETFINDSFTQKFNYTYTGKRRQRMFPLKDSIANLTNLGDTIVVGGNVIGKIPGKINKTIVITGHLDHLGIRNGKIYNGADDDASGTAALFAIAKYFKQNPAKHTLVFAAVDAEEIGSLGADYFLKNYPSKEDIVLNINMDMIAHNNNQQLYASGLFHNPQLKPSLENIESPISLLFGHDDPKNKELDDWTFSSDHRIFHKEEIPFIYFGVEDHKDYHKPTDTFENINQEFYVDAVKLIVQAIVNFDNSLN